MNSRNRHPRLLAAVMLLFASVNGRGAEIAVDRSALRGNISAGFLNQISPADLALAKRIAEENGLKIELGALPTGDRVVIQPVDNPVIQPVDIGQPTAPPTPDPRVTDPPPPTDITLPVDSSPVLPGRREPTPAERELLERMAAEKRKRDWIQQVVPTPEIKDLPDTQVQALAVQTAPAVLQQAVQEHVSVAIAWVSSRSRPMLRIAGGFIVGLDDYHPPVKDSADVPVPDLQRATDHRKQQLLALAQSTIKFKSGSGVLGSGLLVKPGVVLTAEHVACGIRMIRAQGGTVVAELSEDPFPIDKVLQVRAHATLAVGRVMHPAGAVDDAPREGDFAVIAVEESATPDLTTLINFQDDLGKSANYQALAAVGYPVPKLGENVESVILEKFADIFGGQPGTLRISPGVTRVDKNSPFSHDAACMGGNSGGPIMNLETGDICGLHTGGHKGFNGFVSFHELEAEDRSALEKVLKPTFVSSLPQNK